MHEPPNKLSNKCFNRFKIEEIEEQKNVWERGEDRNVKLITGDLAECNVKSASDVMGSFRGQVRLWQLDGFFTCVSAWQRGLNFVAIN